MIISINEYKKYIENRQNIIDILSNLPIGSIVDESDVYQYIEQLNFKNDPFFDITDGNLSDRIESYKKFKLQEINIDEIDVYRFQTDLNIVKQYAQQYKSTKNYPPIVLGHEFLINDDDDFSIEKDEEGKPIVIGDGYEIIDGAHRTNALLLNSVYTVKAFVGILE